MAGETKILHRIAEFKTPLARISYSRDLFKARSQEEGKPPKFGCTLIFKKEDKKELLKQIKQLLIETPGWGGEAALARFEKKLIKNPLLEDTGPGSKSPARSKKTDDIHPGMEEPGMFFIRPSAGKDFQPYVWWKDFNIREIDDKNVYSGCYGKAVLNLYSYNHVKSGDGIGVGISKFQKLHEGERLSGGGDDDAEKWHETIADESPAPNVGGAGASGLFGD